ncbi:MAG: hypothetical protein HYZ48_05675 [Chlamydiales bacterium]|nr:hypothetical protein [Chlamydiales bacterium]
MHTKKGFSKSKRLPFLIGISICLLAYLAFYKAPTSPIATPTIEVIPNFTVPEEEVRRALQNRDIDARVLIKNPREYAKMLRKKKGFFPKIARRLHLYPSLDSPETQKIVFFNLTPSYCGKCDLSRLPKEKLVLFMFEPPVVLWRMYQPKVLADFGKVYTWDDDLVDDQKFFKFYYPVLRPMLPDLPSFEEKKLCTLVSSNLKSRHPLELYSERRRVIEYFEKLNTTDFEFYGHKWPEGVYANYRGMAADKLQTIKGYRFSICYENMRDVKGYVTEKIFDCFAAGSVPVYWGASNVTETIPEGCFIDRRKFSSLDELYAFLKAMTKEEYEGYLQRIEAYLISDKAKLYSREHYENIFCEALL